VPASYVTHTTAADFRPGDWITIRDYSTGQPVQHTEITIDRSEPPEHLVGRRVKLLDSLDPARKGKLGTVERVLYSAHDMQYQRRGLPAVGWVAAIALDDSDYLCYMPVQWVRPIKLGFGAWVKTDGKGKP